MKEGGECVFGLKEKMPAASEERGGRDEETWDGLMMIQPFMPQRTKPTLLTRLLPSFTKILTVSTSVCVALLLFYASVSLCLHTVTVLVSTYKHTHSHRRILPDIHAYSRDSPTRGRRVNVEELVEPGISAQRFFFSIFCIYTHKCTNTHTFTL